MLKPNDDYGGKGIVLGWEVDDAAWEAAVRTALAEPYIVQERIVLPYGAVSRAWWTGGWRSRDRMLDTAPFVAYGESRRRLPDPPLDRGAAQRHRGRRLDRPTFMVETR